MVLDALLRAALRQGDLDWLNFVNTTFNVAMYGHQNELYDGAFKEYFGLDAPGRTPGFPSASETARASARRAPFPPTSGLAAAQAVTGSWATLSTST